MNSTIPASKLCSTLRHINVQCNHGFERRATSHMMNTITASIYEIVLNSAQIAKAHCNACTRSTHRAIRVMAASASNLARLSSIWSKAVRAFTTTQSKQVHHSISVRNATRTVYAICHTNAQSNNHDWAQRSGGYTYKVREPLETTFM